jgi:hypothetical protein
LFGNALVSAGSSTAVKLWHHRPTDVGQNNTPLRITERDEPIRVLRAQRMVDAAGDIYLVIGD